MKKELSQNKKRTIFITLMIIFPLIQFAIFTVYVNVKTLIMAFFGFDYETNEVVFVGLENFKRFIIEFQTSDMWKRAIVNSFWYFPVSAFVTLPITVVVSYFLYNKVYLSSFFKVVFYIPNIISVVVLALVFRAMFNYSSGPVNLILMNVFNMPIEEIPIWFNDTKVTMKLLYVYAVWAGIGGNVILTLGAMARVPKEVCEAGQLDGVGMTRELCQIYLPIIWPTVSTFIVFGVASMFSMFIHTAVLTDGAGDSYTVASIIMTKVKEGKNPYYVAMLSLLLTIVAVPVTQLAKYLVNKIWSDVEV